MSNTALNYTDEVSDVIAEALRANNKLKFLKLCGNNIATRAYHKTYVNCHPRKQYTETSKATSKLL